MFTKRFQHQVKRRAQLVASYDDDSQQTYEALNYRVQDIVANLIAQSVDTHSVVAVVLPEGPDKLASLLALFQLGGSVLPISEDTSDERLAVILAATRVDTVLSHGAFLQRVGRLHKHLNYLDVSAGCFDHTTHFSKVMPGEVALLLSDANDSVQTLTYAALEDLMRGRMRPSTRTCLSLKELDFFRGIGKMIFDGTPIYFTTNTSDVRKLRPKESTIASYCDNAD